MIKRFIIECNDGHTYPVEMDFPDGGTYPDILGILKIYMAKKGLKMEYVIELLGDVKFDEFIGLVANCTAAELGKYMVEIRLDLPITEFKGDDLHGYRIDGGDKLKWKVDKNLLAVKVAVKR